MGTGTRIINAAFRQLTKLGLGASYRRILTVRGRRTGRIYSTPVDVMEHADTLWLVAGYGPSNWVRNAQVAGQVTLSRGGEHREYLVSEVASSEAVPVLRKCMQEIRVTRPYFDASPDAPDEVIATELTRHPTLRLTRVP